MSCGYCKELGHYKPTCLKYKADLLRNRLDNVSDNPVINRPVINHPVIDHPRAEPFYPVVVLPQPPRPELEIVRSSPQPNVPDFPMQKAKLNKELKKRIIRRHESKIRRLFRELGVDDVDDVKFNELSNKYLQEEFEHQNGLVNISDMKTVMTTKYISRLFGNNNVKDDISCQINEYLESFDGDDGFDDW